ncbi:MAG: FKBP-type peptidyl-prolyl cis-trans isomerase [Muribaculaceae bacterium]
MKLTKYIVLGVIAALSAGFVSCSDDDEINLEDYQVWRQANDDWVNRLRDSVDAEGNRYYEVVVPAWNPSAFVLMHFFNDRSETAQNLTPLYTSVVDVIYEGYTCLGEQFDSSKDTNKYGRTGIQRFGCNRTIQGWSIALENMHVGDTCELIVPYQVAYGSATTSVLPPYTSLRFNMRLYDIYKYEGSSY